MSEQYPFTNEQKKMLAYCYKHERTYADVARLLHRSPEYINSHLTSFHGSTRYLFVRFPDQQDYAKAVISLEPLGEAYVESLRSDRSDRRMATRRFWIQILFGGLLGWLLTAFGSPHDLFQAIASLFR